MKRSNATPAASFPIYDVTMSFVRDYVEQVPMWSFEDYEETHGPVVTAYGNPIPYFFGVSSPDPCTCGLYLVVNASVVYGRVESLEVAGVYRDLSRAVGRAWSCEGINNMASVIRTRKFDRGQLDVDAYVLYESEIWRVVADDSLVAVDRRSFHADITFPSGERVGIDFLEPSTFEWLKGVSPTLLSVRVTELRWKVLVSGREIGHRFVVYCSPEFVPQESEE